MRCCWVLNTEPLSTFSLNYFLMVGNGDMTQDEEFALRLRKLLDNDGKEVDEIKIWIDTDNGLFEINSVTEQTGTDCNGKLVRQVFIETA